MRPRCRNLWSVALAAIAACRGGSSHPAARDAATGGSPERAVSALRAWIAATERPDGSAAEKLVADDVIVATADPPEMPLVEGRAELRKLYEHMPARDRHCALQLAIATGDQAVGLVHCAGKATSAKPPSPRATADLQVLSIHLDASGAIDRATLWEDLLRHLRQLGVAIEVAAQPEAPWPAPVIAMARGDAAEAANAAAARDLVLALDRRDTAAVARHVAPGFRRYLQSDDAAPRVFETPATFAAQIDAELRRCDSSAYATRDVVAAGDWVALRFGRTCRMGKAADAKEVHTRHLALMRFEHGLVVESWELHSRYSEWLQLGKLADGELPRLIAAALD